MDGFLNLNKPSGITSFDVIRRLRGFLGIRKMGHSGTLDPLARGVLPIALGKGTRLLPFFPNLPKKYHAVFTTGFESPTEDLEGPISRIKGSKTPTLSELTEIVKNFEGEIFQRPPDFSSLKIEGKRAYQLARKGRGKPLNLKERHIEIYSITPPIPYKISGLDPRLLTPSIQEMSPQFNLFEITVTCQKGTYIRSLIRDIGNQLECGAVLVQLTRLESDGFTLENSFPLEMREDLKLHVIPLLKPFESFFPLFTIPKEWEKMAKNGGSLPGEKIFSPQLNPNSGSFFGSNLEGDFLAIYTLKDLLLKPERIIHL